jgi:hypothetical protein
VLQPELIKLPAISLAELEYGASIGAYDMQIAAQAIGNGLILVPHNAGEFSRISELQIENWE